MAILSDLIQPLSLQEFSDKHLFKQPYASPLKAEPFRNLISWPLLWEIFNSGHQDCWLPKQGLLPPEPDLQTGHLTFEQARKGYEEGRTILIRHAEKAHPKLAAIAQDFHRLFQDPVDIQIYCTPPEEEGFDWHYDSEEVFVIQSGGEKEFRLRKNTLNPSPQHMRIPKNMRFENEPPAPEIRCLLKAGDWLYIPSGWWHKARALSPSFHMSVGVMALTGLNYLESLIPELGKNPLYQKRLPLRGAMNLLPSDDQKKEIQVFLTAMRDHLSQILSDEKKFLQHQGQIPKV